jgi:hypothetical protein
MVKLYGMEFDENQTPNYSDKPKYVLHQLIKKDYDNYLKLKNFLKSIDIPKYIIENKKDLLIPNSPIMHTVKSIKHIVWTDYIFFKFTDILKESNIIFQKEGYSENFVNSVITKINDLVKNYNDHFGKFRFKSFDLLGQELFQYDIVICGYDDESTYNSQFDLFIGEILDHSIYNEAIRIKNLKTHEISYVYPNKNSSMYKNIVKLTDNYNTLVTLFLLKE